MYVCARFHEIPAKGLQDIKETKCYGRDGRTDVKTVYPPYNFVIAGGIKIPTIYDFMDKYYKSIISYLPLISPIFTICKVQISGSFHTEMLP